MKNISRIIPLTCAALMAFALFQSNVSAQAKGMDVTEVRIAAAGVAPEVIYRQSAPKTWQVISGGRVTGTCNETGRDEWSVYLACAENTRITLNLFRKERRIIGNAGSTLTSPIASASNAPIGAGSPSASQMSIDAALFVATENASYLFQGDHYYRLTAGTKVDPNYPMKLPGEWKGLQAPFTSGIDAAVQDPYSKTIYFFKGNEYAAINPGNKTVYPGYSNVKLPGGWQGLPASFHSGIDAALDDNGSIILYKGNRQIVIKNERFVTESAVPASVLTAGSPINAAFKFSNGRNYFFSGEKVARASGFAVDGGWPYPIKDVWAGVNGGTAPATTATTTVATTAPNTAPITATRSATAPAPRPPLSPNELDAVMRWISVKTSAERLPFCWRQSYGNTAGKPMVCQAGYEESSPGICSQNCQAGERGIATFCYKNCPTGFRDDGLYCGKPASYSRGAGYVIWDQALCEKQNPQGCETQGGAIWYPKCKQNYHGIVTDCTPDCPQGWEDIGVSCKKPSRFRDTKPVSVCPPGMDKGPADQICYPQCRTDFEPRGPVCWQKCPSQQSFDCGAGCATSESQCTEAVFSMVSGPIRAALQIIAIAATAGGAAGVNEAANVDKFARAAATVEALNDLVDAAEAIKDLAQNQSFQELLSDPNTSGATRAKIDEYSREFVEHFAEMTSNEVDREIDKRFTNQAAALEVKRQWSLRHLAMMLEANGISTAKATLGVAAIGDPTGIADVINAFTHPVCKDNTPFPAINPLY